MTYVTPRTVTDLSECHFYHTMEVPGYGLIEGQWDLRGLESTYLGGINLNEKRVLEIGTASGFFCFYMERQGAEVVAYDLSDEYDWDVVPIAGLDHNEQLQLRRDHIRRINNAFWLAYRSLGSQARVVYGDVYRIPDGIGRVDVATFGSVLLHCRDPFAALASVARLTDETIVVTDLTPVPELGIPAMQFIPDIKSVAPIDPCTWWRLSPEIIQRFLGVLGFADSVVARFAAPYDGREEGVFTVVATRPGSGVILAPGNMRVEPAESPSPVHNGPGRKGRFARWLRSPFSREKS